MSDRGKALSVLSLNTFAFTICFAVWTMYGVLITWLVDNKVYDFDKAQMGWLIGIPILTGSLFRLPVGVLTDKYGGRPVFAGVLLSAAAGAWATTYANSFATFALCGLAFGLAGTGFAVGIAYTSVWFPRHQQGTALGIFGVGNAGAALTSLGAPAVLKALTAGGTNVEAWRQLPKIYALLLVGTTAVFWLLTTNKKVDHGQELSLGQRLEPLKVMRVWRFGLYYFLVFGGFVALASWLIPYYVNVYQMSVATAGVLAAIFSLPSGVIRALGGWLSDRFGARSVMYWVLGGTALCCLLLVVPRMDIYAPGEGVMATGKGVVETVDGTTIVVSGKSYTLRGKPDQGRMDEGMLVWPSFAFWHEAAVKPGDAVVKRQLLARGVTHVYFQANVWIFTFLAFLVGILMGIGKAAVYKYIPEYFPKQVGVVGGIVGVLGGLGGFFCPIFFGYLLKGSGLWTTCWMFFFLLSVACLGWMHLVVRRLMAQRAPHLAQQFETPHGPVPLPALEPAVAAGREGTR